MTHHVNLDTLTLDGGSHDSREDGVCIMEGWETAAVRLTAFLRPGPNGCIEFTGTRTNQGYGRLTVNGDSIGAHRVAWATGVGQIPADMAVLHRCDNPPCCNVDHLFLGTIAENNRDRAAKGRSRGTFPSGVTHPAKRRGGQYHWKAKLSDRDVRQLRQRYNQEETQVSLAAEFGVNSATVSRIVRRIWRQEVI